MKINPTRFEKTYRQNIELSQALGWEAGVALSGIGALVYYAVYGFIFPPVWLASAGVCAGMCLKRRHEAIKVLKEHQKLRGQDFSFTDFETLKKKVFPNYRPEATFEELAGTAKSVWLGYGFLWEKDQIQKLTEIMGGSLEQFDLQPLNDNSGGFSDMSGKHAKKGFAAIHGLGNETNIYQPLSHINGHTLILGTTGAGKTRLFDLLISQAVMRNEAVLIFDPKGDAELEANARRACEKTGDADRFISIRLNDPENSARIDPLANFQEATELASRIKCLLGTEDDVFTKYASAFATSIIEGMMLANEKPTLDNLFKYIQGSNLAGLVCRLVRTYAKTKPDYEQNLTIALTIEEFPEGLTGLNVKEGYGYLSKGGKSSGKIRVPLNDFHKAHYWAAYFRQFLLEEKTKSVRNIGAVIAYFEHDPDHLSKMLSNLVGALTEVTSGNIGDLVNPSEDNEMDFYNLRDMTRERRVVYFGLNTLQYQNAGRAIGAILLSDLAQVAADRYNNNHDMIPLNVFVDECAEVANDPLIALLNKGRGAKFQIYCASQTIADFTTRFGSKDKTESALGNFNNMICLRLQSKESMEYFSETCMKTKINYVMHTQSTSITADDPMTASANSGERLMEEEAELVPAQLLKLLPDLEYFASLSGGKIFKGRLPFLSEENAAKERREKKKDLSGSRWERFAKKCLLIN